MQIDWKSKNLEIKQMVYSQTKLRVKKTKLDCPGIGHLNPCPVLVQQKKLLDFFSDMTLAQFPKFDNLENLFFHAKLPEEALSDTFPRNDAPRRSQTRLDFFSKMTLAQFPVF